MRLRTTPLKKARALLDLTAFREAPFDIFSLGLFLAFIGLYFPFFYTPIYGMRIAHLSDDVSFYLLPVMNAGSIAGRIVPGLLADKYGSLNTIVPHAFFAAILTFAWLGINDAAGLWVLVLWRHSVITTHNHSPHLSQYGLDRHAHGYELHICGLWTSHWQSDRRRYLECWQRKIPQGGGFQCSHALGWRYGFRAAKDATIENGKRMEGMNRC